MISETNNSFEKNSFFEEFPNFDFIKGQELRDIRNGDTFENDYSKCLKQFMERLDKVNEEKMESFFNRSTALKGVRIEGTNDFDVHDIEQPISKDSIWSRYSPKKKLFTAKQECNYSSQQYLLIWKACTIHYYNAPVFFAGVPSEIYCQIPKSLQKENSHIYYTSLVDKEGYMGDGFHRATTYIWKKI